MNWLECCRTGTEWALPLSGYADGCQMEGVVKTEAVAIEVLDASR